ncbi:MAG: hypothetical protein WDW38_010783 [Sanguina aurantia]
MLGAQRQYPWSSGDLVAADVVTSVWLVLLVVGGSARSLLCVVITVAMALAHGGVVLCLRQQYADKGWPVNPGASNARDDPLQSWVSNNLSQRGSLPGGRRQHEGLSSRIPSPGADAQSAPPPPMRSEATAALAWTVAPTTPVALPCAPVLK